MRRKANLSSLYDYILRCNKEIGFLNEQELRIRKTDWSDLMRESGVRSEYEVKEDSQPGLTDARVGGSSGCSGDSVDWRYGIVNINN